MRPCLLPLLLMLLFSRGFVPNARKMFWATSSTYPLLRRFPSRSAIITAIATPATFLQPQRLEDTIYALSSGVSGMASGVAVIRISGPRSFYCMESLSDSNTYARIKIKGESTSNSTIKPIEPRAASLRKLYCPETGDTLDQALILWFPAPRSFTGEDVVEFQVHGSRAVVRGVFDALRFLDEQDGREKGAMRAAEPGEFTRRAFERGKMDLTEVEGLADLLAADTKTQRKQALRQIDGMMRKQYEEWRGELLKCLAHSEAVIDFGDDDRESDISDNALYELNPRIERLMRDINRHLQDGGRGELIRDGIRIAIAGLPNAGKSSLMNSLAKRPAAIVSPIAGTTRDVVEIRLDLDGVSCIISDTAGLREETADIIEIEGIKRAKAAFMDAQIRIFVCDAGDEASFVEAEVMLTRLLQELEEGNCGGVERELGSEDEEEEEEIEERFGREKKESVSGPLLLIMNKSDLLPSSSSSSIERIQLLVNNYNNKLISKDKDNYKTKIPPTLALSCLNGDGITDLEKELSLSVVYLLESVGATSDVNADSALITRDRHRRHVTECANHLNVFLNGRVPTDAAAEELRLAMLELGKITGIVDVDEILDIIFRDFCIGK